MSKITVKAAIDQALKTPKGNPQVSKAEAQAIAKAALTEPHGAPHVTADEAKLISTLLSGDSFDGGKTHFQLTAPARQVLEAFAKTAGLPIGANADAMKAQIEGVLANVDQGAALTKAPSTSSLLKLPLSDNRASDGALREALINPTTGSFYLRTTSQARGQTKPVVSYYGPFSVTGTPPAPAKLSAAELAVQLPKVADGYTLMSETDISLRPLVGPKAATIDAATIVSAFGAAHDAQAQSMFGTTENTPLASKFPQEVNADEFFTRYSVPYDPSDPYIVSSAQKFASVAALLKANLTDIHVFRFSEGDPKDNIHAPGQVSIFITGKTASGELFSVMTGAVET